MKRTLLIYIIMFSNAALATEYFSMVDLENTAIVAGDKVISETVGIYSREKNTKNTLNIGTGKISIDINYKGGDYATGIDLSNPVTHNLGIGSSINMYNFSDVARSMEAINLAGSSLVADQLQIKIDAVSGAPTGIIAEKSTVMLGDNSTIHINGARGGLGASLTQSTFEANNLTLDVGTGYPKTDIDLGMLIDTSNVHFKGKTILNSSAEGIQLLSTKGNKYSELIVDQLEMNAKRTGIDSNVGTHKINLGSGSKITVNGDNATGIRIIDDHHDEALTAKNLTINIDSKSGYALNLMSSVINIDGAVFTVKGRAAIRSGSAGSWVGPGTSQLFLANATLNMDGYYGIYSSATQGLIDLKNVHIDIKNGADSSYAIYAVDTLFNIENLSINTGRGSTGIVSNSGANVNIKGALSILPTTAELGTALVARGDASKITIDSQLQMRGDWFAQDNSLIDVKSSTKSWVEGAINQTGTSSITWSGEGTRWNIMGDSNLTRLALANSVVNYAAATGFHQLQVAHLAGDSHFKFKVDLINNQFDQLNISQSSAGLHTVSLVNSGSSATLGTEKLTLIKTADGKAVFKADTDYEFGGYLYSLRRVDNNPNSTDWEVFSTGGRSNPAQASASTVVGNYLINLAEQEHLTQRLGTLRADQSATGAWVRTYGGKFRSFASRQLNGFDMNYSGLQLGVDGQISHTADARWYLGAALANSSATHNYQAGSGKQNSYSATLYATYVNDTDWYSDFYLKYAHYQNKLNVRDSQATKVKAKGTAHGISASAEIGKRIAFTEQFSVEPSAQLIAGRINSNTIKNSNGLTVDFASQNSLISKVGSKFIYTTELAGQPLELYSRVHYAHEFAGKQKYRLNNSKETLKFSGNSLEYGIGASSLINKRHTVFIETNANTGTRFDKYDFNLGYRYSF